MSCQLKKGKVYGVVGPSGAGKSVFCEHLNGLQRSETANIYYSCGEKILFFQNKLKNYKKIRREVGMVFQLPDYQLFKETVLQDITFGPKILFNIPPSEMPEWERKAREILEELSFPLELINSSPFKLSGGQKRKVTLAGILILEPKVIVFDEPILGLDPQSVNQVIELVNQLNKKGVTIVISSNNMDFILETTDNILFLEDEKLKRNEPTFNFFKDCPDSLIKPKVIQFIENLVRENKKFEGLWSYKPRNIPELALSISNVVQRSS
ncbi:energy-coupling factor ABC transporter ATP-binding protein [Mycoplasma suis]|uniref:energy-coupling factor ABC transporter ATP-binding protein n=1 Tax=Mycoplasma suis TaxID=57372 RepID=UPI0009D9D921|nr:ATP-binding cassette domain-containing protein [Mycoplasma suis]